MGDTLDETPPPMQRDKPQTLNISEERGEQPAEQQQQVAPDSVAAAAASSSSSAMRSPRPYTRNDRDRDRELRDHSCDSLGLTSKRNDEFSGLAATPRRESLNACEKQQQSASGSSGFASNLNKALGFGNRGPMATASSASSTSTPSTSMSNTSRYSSSVVVGGGIGNLAGTTTRKCVLTLDGYSYVIVASTPETLPSGKREEGNLGAGGSNSSCINSAASNSSGSIAGGGVGATAGGVATLPDNGIQSPTSSDLGNSANATINGQVAKHGSLTIVRRSNSRKNFTQIDGQTQSSNSIASPSSSGSHNIFQSSLSGQFNSEPLTDRLLGSSGGGGRAGGGTNGSSAILSNTSAADKIIRQQQQQQQQQQQIGIRSSLGRMQPSSPNQTNFLTDSTDIAAVTDRPVFDFRLSTRETVDYPQPVAAPIASLLNSSIDPSSQHSMESASNASVLGEWETETLPPVDTPDALNKAAVRIRSLLRRMDHETVAYEDMQRNLHYAARVLEAVFIDETRSPTSGKSKLGQIASSSVESEDEPGKQRCNGNCQNLNNNNANSSCSMHHKPTTTETEASTAAPTAPTDNQPSIESRKKGVSMAPQTHSGPTGPPASTPETMQTDAALIKAPETVAGAAITTTAATASTETTTATTVTTTTPSNESAVQSVSSSSSCSNKATVQRQRRLRTPVWARSMSTNKTRLADEDDELSEVQPDAVPPEVREWLASTFTRQMATTRNRSDEKPKFRSVAHAIRAGIFVDRIYRRVSSTTLMQFPPDVVKLLKNLDEWTFDVFALTEAASGQVIKYVAYDLLNRYGAMHKFKIAPGVLETFLHRVEEGYCRYRNPYHNNLHAVDVMHTMHYCLCNTGLMNWLTDLEIFASLLAALLHDFEHTGTTNNFHVMSGSETALLYNDRAVLENHHVSASFRLMKDDDANILSHLSREEYKELRTLIIDMVLATDMTYHFQQLKIMRNLLTIQEPSIDKSKALSLVLHCCDISHPAKHWDVHHRWTMLLLEEFFRQGDLEKELGLPFSPLCDRKNTLVAESQIGFIDFIVEPSMTIMSDMLEHILTPIAPVLKPKPAPLPEEGSGGLDSDAPLDEPKKQLCPMTRKSIGSNTAKFTITKPWLVCLAENKKIWKEQAIKDAEARALAAAAEAEAETDDKKQSTAETDTTTEQKPETEATATAAAADDGAAVN